MRVSHLIILQDNLKELKDFTHAGEVENWISQPVKIADVRRSIVIFLNYRNKRGYINPVPVFNSDWGIRETMPSQNRDH